MDSPGRSRLGGDAADAAGESCCVSPAVEALLRLAGKASGCAPLPVDCAGVESCAEVAATGADCAPAGNTSPPPGLAVPASLAGGSASKATSSFSSSLNSLS